MTDFQDYMNTHKTYPDDISRRIDIAPGFDSFRDTATDGKPHPDNGVPAVKDSLTTALDENGLARCGCGGKAEIVKTYDENSWTNIVHVACKKCKIHITFTAPAELHGTDALKDDAKAAWNRAMGYKGADE